jgi:hypothetical protein
MADDSELDTGLSALIEKAVASAPTGQKLTLSRETLLLLTTGVKAHMRKVAEDNAGRQTSSRGNRSDLCAEARAGGAG